MRAASDQDRQRRQYNARDDKRSAAPSSDHGIVRDDKGQEQPRDKERAQHVSRLDKGGDPPGRKG
jgi:hypothetical protein